MKKIVLIIAMMLLGAKLFAQDDFVFGSERHEFSVGVGFGHLGLRGENPAFRFGGNLSFMYALNFNENWALVTGLELALHRAQWSSDGFFDTVVFHGLGLYPPDLGNTWTYFVDAGGIRETQWATYLYIPLMVRAKIPVGINNALYAMGGIKFGIPIINSYSVNTDRIKTTGRTPGGNPIDNRPELGFNTFTNLDFSGSLDLWFSAALSLELGYIHTLRNGRAMHFGAFTNFGLNDVLRNPDPHMINYNFDNPVIPALTSYTGRFGSLRPRTFGVMVRFGF